MSHSTQPGRWDGPGHQADLAEPLSVSRATVHSVLERDQHRPAPSTSGGK
jgi:hypothetical protein